jgi:hypothetical protein
LSDTYERDVSEDSSVGAYIGSVEGGRRDDARKFVHSVRASGFQTPLWALADSSSIADVGVVEMAGEVDGFVYLGQQTPAFYAKQIIASLINYGKTLPALLRGLMAYDGEATSPSTVRAIRVGSSPPQISGGAAIFSSTSAKAFFAMTFAMPTWTMATFSFTRGRRSKHRRTPRGFSAPTRPTSS